MKTGSIIYGTYESEIIFLSHFSFWILNNISFSSMIKYHKIKNWEDDTLYWKFYPKNTSINRQKFRGYRRFSRNYSNQRHLVIEASLSPSPSVCTTYGSSAKDVHGRKRVMVRFDSFNHMPMVMRLAKQRYTCKNCKTHWTAQSYFVRPNPSIVTCVTFKIIDWFSEKVSFTFIAKYCHVSLTTVIRTLKELGFIYLIHRKILCQGC